MGAIAAALNKHGEDAVSSVLLMLKQLTHRGADFFHVTTPTSRMKGKFLSQLETKKCASNTAVGQYPSPVFSREKPQPIIIEKNSTLIFEGHLYPSSKTSDAQEVAQCLKPRFQTGARSIVRKFDGSYAFIVASPDNLLAGRDLFGTTPLFYGENEMLCALASERKALWALGIINVKSFPPGNLAVISVKGFDFKPPVTVTLPPQRRIGLEKAASHLQSLLLKSTSERVLNLKEVAVAFSGGLDSSILAVLAKTCTTNVNLITVGLKGQPELLHAQKAAESLKLPLHLQTYTVVDVEKALEKVLWLIEEPNVMKVGVALPLFWAAETASRNGCHVLLAGQGADELFGGYHRYLTDYNRGGVKAVQESMFHDLTTSYETNFQRDNPVCAFHKVELRLPHIDREVVQFALSLPLNLKIQSVDDQLRKRILRQVAKNLGIPEFIFERTKKAVQYAAGVDKALRELARKRGLSAHDYLKQVFGRIYPNWKG